MTNSPEKNEMGNKVSSTFLTLLPNHGFFSLQKHHSNKVHWTKPHLTSLQLLFFSFGINFFVTSLAERDSSFITLRPERSNSISDAILLQLCSIHESLKKRNVPVFSTLSNPFSQFYQSSAI